MSRGKPLALKPFCEALEHRCRELSYEELVELVLRLGARVRPGDRIDFLEQVGSLFDPASLEVDSGSLIERIETFVQEIRTRWETIDDGSYWELYAEEEVESYNEDRHYGDPFGVPAMTSVQWEALLELLAEADALFADGKLDEAGAAYEPLLSLFRRENDFTSYRPVLDDDDQHAIELRETRARYARCVYETTPPESRLERTLAAMEANVHHPFADSPLLAKYPTFAEMADARRSELPDKEAFLHKWKQRLGEEAETSPRAQSLFFEAVEITEGEPGLRRTAREDRAGRAGAYRYWIAHLRAHNQWHEALDAAREALQVVPAVSNTVSPGPVHNPRDHRRFVMYIAETLVSGGRVLQNDEIVLEGHWAALKHKRSDSSLAELLQTGEALGRRNLVLEQAIEVLASDTERHTRTHVKALIMAGRLGETFAVTRSAKAVGWSHPDSAVGLCFAAILAHASGRTPDGLPTVERLLVEYAEPSWSYIKSRMSEREKRIGSYLVAGVIEGVTKAELDRDLAATYVGWAEKVGRARVDHIVSEKHRGAYRRAAEVLVALAELYAATDRAQRSAELLDEYRIRFNRHSAFKRELREVLSQSDLQGISRRHA